MKYVLCFTLYQEEEDDCDGKAYSLYYEGTFLESRARQSVLTQVFRNLIQSPTLSLIASFSSAVFDNSVTK
jgi:hypothetical protein